MPSELEIASTLARRGFKGGSAVDAVRVITNPEFCGIRENLEVGEIGQRYCRWPEDTITWTIRDTLSALGEKMRLGCEAALADISSYFQLDFPYVERADEANILITVAPLGGPMGVLADCQLVPCNIGDKNNVQMLMRADRSEQWVWANTPSGMAIDWQRVFAHEWVHGLGLPHIKTPNSLLNPTYSTTIRTLQPGTSKRWRRWVTDAAPRRSRLSPPESRRWVRRLITAVCRRESRTRPRSGPGCLRNCRAMRMGSLGTLIAVVALAVSPADVAVARADYAASVAQGQEPRYLALHSTDPSLIAATMFMVPASSTGKVLDGMVPQRMPGTNLLRIDLRELQWDVHSWMAVAGYPNNPMVAHENPLIVDASWLLNELADGTQSAAYFKLMFGKKQPKTLDEFLAAFGIDRKQQDGLQYGVIPNTSGVNLARNASRLMEHSDGVYSEAWLTYDVKDVKDGADPLQGLFANGFKSDGTEGYVLTTRLAGTERVILPVTFLADAKGNLVHEAPADLVEDTTELFGDRIIRSPGSCFVCHTEGSQPVDGNALADRLRAGVELKAYEYAKQKQIEFFHLANTAPELKRWDDGFARALVHINGMTPAENSAAIKQAIGDYLKDVTLERAASELACEQSELVNALAWASVRKIDVGNRVAGLAHSIPVPRSAFKGEYLKVKRYLDDWRNK